MLEQAMNALNNKWIPLISLVVMLVFTALIYAQLPEAVPTHWNIEGQVDDTTPRLNAVLIMPGIALTSWVVFNIARRIDPRRQSYTQFEDTFQFLINLTALFALVMQVVILGSALGWNIPVGQVIPAGVGLMIAAMGNVMTRVRPNWFIGIRTPWTLASEEVWRRTHRRAAWVLVVVGLLMALIALFTSSTWTPYLILLIVFGGFGYVYVYSYLVWRRLMGQR
jgi:uncharacterized membrane protein